MSVVFVVSVHLSVDLSRATQRGFWFFFHRLLLSPVDPTHYILVPCTISLSLSVPDQDLWDLYTKMRGYITLLFITRDARSSLFLSLCPTFTHSSSSCFPRVSRESDFFAISFCLSDGRGYKKKEEDENSSSEASHATHDRMRLFFIQ